ncbi:MAG: histone H1-like repetitive region-containing protein [Microthrixaceae bacterium]
MSDDGEQDLGLEGKTPAPVTEPGRGAKKAAVKKAPAKKAAVKKAPAKKAAVKKAPARKAAAKKAPAKKAPAKKAAEKKAPARKAPAKKAPAKKVAATRAPAPLSERKAAVAATAGPVVTAPPEHPVTRGAHLRVVRDEQATQHVASGERALVLSVTEDLLNDMVLIAIGAGVALEPLDTSVALPGMGEVDVRLALTVTGGTLSLRADDDGRARVVVTADGDVSARTVAFESGPDDIPGTAMGVPTPPAPIPVRVEALVRPHVELRDDHTLSIGLDLGDATLVSLAVDDTAPTPEGVDQAAWAAMLNVFGMMFGVLGSGLFESLGDHVGTAGFELPADVGDVMVQLGVAPGLADVSIGSGLVTVTLAGDEDLRGDALPVPVAGKRLGIGLANSVVDGLAHLLILRAAGDLPVPFELDVDLGEQQVAGRLRQSRLLPEGFPDLRSSLRTEVRTRLVRGRLELAVQAAWLELPSMVPSIFNQVSKRLGGLVALTPMKVRFPATIEVPLPDVDATLPVQIDDLRVTSEGLGVVLSMG